MKNRIICVILLVIGFLTSPTSFIFFCFEELWNENENSVNFVDYMCYRKSVHWEKKFSEQLIPCSWSRRVKSSSLACDSSHWLHRLFLRLYTRIPLKVYNELQLSTLIGVIDGARITQSVKFSWRKFFNTQNSVFTLNSTHCYFESLMTFYTVLVRDIEG